MSSKFLSSANCDEQSSRKRKASEESAEESVEESAEEAQKAIGEVDRIMAEINQQIAELAGFTEANKKGNSKEDAKSKGQHEITDEEIVFEPDQSRR